jgi:heme/copper-type cytochrome/quinol oxidase subunit 4
MSAIAPCRPPLLPDRPVAQDTSWLRTARMEVPINGLVIAIALTLIATGFSLSRTLPDTDMMPLLMFFGGLAMIMSFVTWRLMQAGLTRTERLAIVVMMGLALYAVKVMQHPHRFAYHDEHAHWRSAIDIVRSGRLFQPNPLLPVTPLYPGLAAATASISQVTGLDLHLSSLLLLVSARVIFMLALFHLFEAATRSERAAGLACIIYAVNPNFLFFDSQFSYETLALPLAVMLVYAVLRSQQITETSNIPSLSLIATLVLLSNAMTHHFTSYVTTVLLIGWSVVSFVFKRYRHNQPNPFNIAMLAVLLNAFWLLYVANFTLEYLTYVFKSAFEGLVKVAGSAASNATDDGAGFRAPFTTADDSNAGPPLWQRLLGFASVIFSAGSVPFGAWEVLRRHRTRAMVVIMALAMCTLPATYVLRLTNTSTGWEISNRSAEFIFIGLAPCVSLAVYTLKFPRFFDWLRRVILPPAMAITLIGGIIVGWPTWMLMPWSYVAGSDQRSVELEGIEAGGWTGRQLPDNSKILTDRVNNQLVATYGHQQLAGGSPLLAGIVLAPTFEGLARQIAISTKLDFLLVDLRFTRYEPYYGYYYSEAETKIYPVLNPLPRASLEKFDSVPGVHRVFDSGGIVIYDLRAVTDGQ